MAAHHEPMAYPGATNQRAAGNEADIHLQRLLAAEEEPFFRSLIRNVKELINPPKLPPLEVTSQPVPVKDIWGLYGRKKESFLMSTVVQFAIVGLLIWAFSTKAVQQQVKQVATLIMPTDIQPYQPKMAPKKQTMGGGGGGGDRSPLPASKGRLPKVSLRQFTPPMAVVN